MTEISGCRIFGVPISRMGFKDAIQFAHGEAQAGRGGAFYFVNVHSLTESLENLKLSDAMKKARACFADGMPLVWVSKKKGQPIGSRVCGPDFMKALIERTQNQCHGFVGGAPGRSEVLAERLGLKLTAHYSPPMRGFSEQNVREDLAEFEKRLAGRGWPKFVWVGLGAPKQELWIEVAARIQPEVCFFGVGAAFDFLAELKPRAPEWMQNAGLEWFFRLASEPKRLAGRYFTTNSKFIVTLIASGELKRS